MTNESLSKSVTLQNRHIFFFIFFLPTKQESNVIGSLFRERRGSRMLSIQTGQLVQAEEHVPEREVNEGGPQTARATQWMKCCFTMK